jgi:ABC-type uncharacterized transport system substrate-binding protein
LTELADALVRSNVDVIVTVDRRRPKLPKLATSTIPIVIAVSADPVGAGLVGVSRSPAATSPACRCLRRTPMKKTSRL